MIKAKRTPFDLIDTIYTLAHWLTASDMKAVELVSNTYLKLDYDTSETEVFKSFRASYLNSIDQDEAGTLSETPCFSKETPEATRLKQDADIRLSLLLSVISGLKHKAISGIIGKPLDTIRVGLSEGRKSLVHSSRFACLL
jgi:hypothetical protein